VETALAITLAVLALPLAAAVFLGLPGHIAVVAAAALLELIYPGRFSWWTIGLAAAAVALAEIVELAAGAAGAKLAKSSARAALAAIAGGLVGGIVGTLALPIVGTLAGAAIGAALAAIAFEATLIDKRDIRHLSRLGIATAATRVVALAIKGAIAVLIAAAIAADAVFF
jgi:uncharacterized protein YqgC (DUF456 family)